MINPDFGGAVNSQDIPLLGSWAKLQVLEDDIGSLLDAETRVLDTGNSSLSEDGSVGSNIDDTAAGENGFKTNDLGCCTLDSCNKCCACGDGGRFSSCSSSGSSTVSDERASTRKSVSILILPT